MDKEQRDHLAEVLENHKNEILDEINDKLKNYVKRDSFDSITESVVEVVDTKVNYQNKKFKTLKRDIDHIIQTDAEHRTRELDEYTAELKDEFNQTINSKFQTLLDKIEEMEYEDDEEEIVTAVTESRQTLESYLKIASLKEDEAIKLAEGLCNELNMYHLKNQLYNNINPSKIFVEHSKNGIELVLDDNTPIRRINCKYTLSDDTDENFDFYPIRKLRTKDFSDDTYALASVLHYMITKSAPEKSDFDQEFDPSNFEKKMSSDVINFLEDALSANPENRYKNIQSFKNALVSLNGSTRYYTKKHNNRIMELKQNNWGIKKRYITAPVVALALTAKEFLPMIIRNNPKKSIVGIGTGLVIAGSTAFSYLTPAPAVLKAAATSTVVTSTAKAAQYVPSPYQNFKPKLNFNFPSQPAVDTSRWVLDPVFEGPGSKWTPKPPYRIDLPRNQNIWMGTEGINGKPVKYFFVTN